MECSKIKMRVGQNEIEAEGPVEFVKEQLESFKELVRLMPTISTTAGVSEVEQPYINRHVSREMPQGDVQKILHMNGRVVSLTALPPSVEDAALLIMLGQKDMRDNVSVTAQEIGDGLAQSGRPVPRVDRVMDAALKEATVLKSGVKRSTRYRLTNQGLAKALNLARDLIANLP